MQGDLFRATKNGEFICYYAQLDAERYLVVLPRVLSSRMADYSYTIVPSERFKALTKNYVLQGDNEKGRPSPSGLSH